jgi:hypothetical protein
MEAASISSVKGDIERFIPQPTPNIKAQASHERDTCAVRSGRLVLYSGTTTALLLTVPTVPIIRQP